MQPSRKKRVISRDSQINEDKIVHNYAITLKNLRENDRIAVVTKFKLKNIHEYNHKQESMFKIPLCNDKHTLLDLGEVKV